MLESNDFDPGRSSRNHLRALAVATGIPHARADELLELVELEPAADRAGKTYSLGMRQRLGLAAAALGDPELLLLDEPANGLDAAGVHWLRGFLRQFADGGRTVLLSSHILAEVAQTVDQVPDHRPRPADRNRATERAGQSRPRADEWIHDPSRPVPFIIDASSAQIGGPDDDAGVEMRGDVLVYTSEALAERLDVIAPVRFIGHVGTSAADTDVTAKPLDVHPSGFARHSATASSGFAIARVTIAFLPSSPTLSTSV